MAGMTRENIGDGVFVGVIKVPQYSSGETELELWIGPVIGRSFVALLRAAVLL